MTTADERLLAQVRKGNTRRVENMLDTGDASVDGNGNCYSRPLLLAAKNGLVRMVKLLISKGADLEAFPLCGAREVNGEMSLLVQGARAVHFAGFYRQIAVLRLLLRAGANPNAVDANDSTPLLLTCRSPEKRLRAAAVRELLQGGADPTLQNDVGNLPLHYAVLEGDTEVIHLLLEKAPLTLNHATKDGVTALCVAAEYGEEGALACFLAAGATNNASRCPLATAVANGHKHIVQRILSKKEWVEAVRGVAKIPGAAVNALNKAQGMAARTSREILHVLLSFEGEERRAHWANCSFDVAPLLYIAASWANLAAASLLLAAGADEKAVDHVKGSTPREAIGMFLPSVERDLKAEAAITRALERGPAFRARSWAWPDFAALPLRNKNPPVDFIVRVFRPESRKFFVRMMWR